ncbi:hypothetical protein FKP32DRAFT_953405 [Trametes sanguinea]|nr:hypothetical protein FKP32DRAFT_953405 [Trametes sanguinea]
MAAVIPSSPSGPLSTPSSRDAIPRTDDHDGCSLYERLFRGPGMLHAAHAPEICPQKALLDVGAGRAAPRADLTVYAGMHPSCMAVIEHRAVLPYHERGSSLQAYWRRLRRVVSQTQCFIVYRSRLRSLLQVQPPAATVIVLHLSEFGEGYRMNK